MILSKIIKRYRSSGIDVGVFVKSKLFLELSQNVALRGDLCRSITEGRITIRYKLINERGMWWSF